VQIFIHSHAQFEDDTLGNIQPVKVMVEDVTRPLSNFRVPEMTRAAAFKTRETTSSRPRLTSSVASTMKLTMLEVAKRGCLQQVDAL